MDKRDGVYYLVGRDRSAGGNERFVSGSAAAHKGLVNKQRKIPAVPYRSRTEIECKSLNLMNKAV
jgi:hypothetical protein